MLLPMLRNPRPGFLKPSTTNNLGHNSQWWRAVCIVGPLVAFLTSSTQVWQPKMSPDITKCSWGAKSQLRTLAPDKLSLKLHPALPWHVWFARWEKRKATQRSRLSFIKYSFLKSSKYLTACKVTPFPSTRKEENMRRVTRMVAKVERNC